MKNANHFESKQYLKITLIRSASGRLPKHKATLTAMGLKRLGHSVSLPNNKATEGMIKAVSYLVKVEE
jgi:large subunit ribosomal protein L30